MPEHKKAFENEARKNIVYTRIYASNKFADWLLARIPAELRTHWTPTETTYSFDPKSSIESTGCRVCLHAGCARWSATERSRWVLVAGCKKRKRCPCRDASCVPARWSIHVRTLCLCEKSFTGKTRPLEKNTCSRSYGSFNAWIHEQKSRINLKELNVTPRKLQSTLIDNREDTTSRLHMRFTHQNRLMEKPLWKFY